MELRLSQRILLGIGFAVLILWSIGPIYWAIATSLTPTPDLMSQPIHFFPQRLTTYHYERLAGFGYIASNDVTVALQFRKALVNSIITSFAATLISVFLATLGGYAFARLTFPGRTVIFFIVIATIAIPGYTVLIPLYRIMIGAKLLDTYTGVTLIYLSAFLPLALWLMRSVFQQLPLSIEEAARIDGAGRLTILFRIVMPLAAPGLVAASIITFLGAWGQYMVPLIFSPNKTKPLTVLIPEFSTKNFIDYGLINAGGTIAMIVPILIVIFLNRYLVSGLTAGSVK
ncbi:carbohydrate ABC transporter permease [Kaistia geumhonensis]|uniref:sn-glycerol-3-phosphate transport system permease protein UgpE n=1 Tax=Kaistia geumhonensis TaxID=410839 RepID=A0ABU0M800_9HYPH|nr:carbohydrate ABC transporter permease [Kaistia geumhonensis]MCX5477737.1 carbohydrate ABC transporter permease [Kaistia geumhonensis]MDQ0517052.1 multiple sugar transport system permease protein [Kaistia geumhonensis]